MPLVTYYPGDGTEQQIEVAWIGDFAPGPDGTCAFCRADPCAERSVPNTPIAQF